MFRLSGRYGWRGTWLIVAGAMWIVLGVGQLFFPLADNPWVLFQHLPNAILAGGWWVTGLVAIGQGLRSSAFDDRADTLGHVALYLMPAVRFVSYLLAWLLSIGGWAADLLGRPYRVGDPTAWYTALIWLLISAMLAVAAAWPNPQPHMPRPPARLMEGDDDGPVT